jgi:hypothetical protein
MFANKFIIQITIKITLKFVTHKNSILVKKQIFWNQQATTQSQPKNNRMYFFPNFCSHRSMDRRKNCGNNGTWLPISIATCNPFVDSYQHLCKMAFVGYE